MSKLFKNQIFILAVCGAVLYLLLTLSSTPAGATDNKNTDALNCIETAGNLLLWESLSHQFVSSVQY